MALTSDVQLGYIGGRVVNMITDEVVPVKVVLYPDFDKLNDLPGGADNSGALLIGADKSVPLATIDDTSVAADTSADLWGYVTDGSGQWKFTVIGDGPEINPAKFTYREVVSSLDGTVVYFDGSVNVPAGQTVWPSSTQVKTSPSAGANKQTVNIIGGSGGSGGVSSWNQLQDKPAVIAAGPDQASARAAIGASDLVLGTTGTTAMPGNRRVDYTADIDNKPDAFPPSPHTHTAANISDANDFSRGILTGVTDAASLRAKAGAGTAGAFAFQGETGADVRSAIGAAATSDIASLNARAVPVGGVAGQALVKQSAADGDAAWQTFSAGGGGNVYFISGATTARVNPVDGTPLPAGASVFWRADTEPINMTSADVWINAPAS